MIAYDCVGSAAIAVPQSFTFKSVRFASVPLRSAGAPFTALNASRS